MGKFADSAKNYKINTSYKAISLSPKKETGTIGFTITKENFIRFCIDGLAMCNSTPGDKIVVTGHSKGNTISAFCFKPKRLKPILVPEPVLEGQSDGKEKIESKPSIN